MNLSAEYQQDGQAAQSDLFEQHIELVHRIAHHVLLRLPTGQQMDDYIQVGLMGLWEASKRYRQGEAASFKTFAGIYIRGAIFDELRRQSWTPRGTQAKSKRIAGAVKAAEARYGRSASSAEIAEELGESLDSYNDMLAETAGAWLMPLDEVDPDGAIMEDDSNPLADIEDDALQGELAEVIRSLPEREQMVMSLYYQEELNLREIGEVIGVGESRVCQIHSQAVARIRARLESGWINPGA